MYGFQPKSARGKTVQQLADGGMVHSIKGMLGLRPKTREELLAADAKNQARNQEAAARVAERDTQQPAATAPAPQSAITDYTGMSAMKRREKEQGLKNGGMVKPHGFKAGGLIRGPGTGTSDSIETEKRPGTFIMPADSTQAIGPEALEEMGEPEEMGEEAESMEGQGGEAGEAVPVRLSNGEFEFPPEQVQALGEAVLTVMRDATHEQAKGGPKGMPKAAGFAPLQFFADGGPVETDVTRVGNSYSGGNVGGSVSINGQAGAGTMSTVPAPVVPAPITAAAPVAAAAPTATPATPAATTATPAAAPAAPMGWAERNAQRSNQVTASSIMDSPERRAAQAALAQAPVAAPAPAIGLDATKPKPFGVQPPAFGTPAGFQPRRYADGGTVQDEEKKRLARAAQPQQGQRGFFPNNSPDAGKNIYAGVGLASTTTPVAQIPATQVEGWRTKAVMDGAAQDAQAAWDRGGAEGVAGAAGAVARGAITAIPTAIGEFAYNTVAPLGGLAKGFWDGVTGGESVAAAPAPSTTPNKAKADPSNKGSGRGSVNPPAVDPTAPAPTNAPASPAGEVAAVNNAAAQAAYTTPSVPAGFQPANVQTPTVRNSTNDWAARKALENAATAASSITANGGRFDQNGPAGSPQAAAYRAALATDQAMQQAQPGLAAVAMRENAGIQREGMQQAGATTRTGMTEQGANAREAGRNALAQGEFGLKREAAGLQTRAAQQQEQLRNVLLDPKSTPEQRAVALRNRAALSDKTAADRMQTVALPDTTNEMGQVVRGGQALVRVLEDGSVQQVPIGAQQGAAPAPQAMPKPASKAEFDALPKGTRFTDPNGQVRIK